MSGLSANGIIYGVPCILYGRAVFFVLFIARTYTTRGDARRRTDRNGKGCFENFGSGIKIKRKTAGGGKEREIVILTVKSATRRTVERAGGGRKEERSNTDLRPFLSVFRDKLFAAIVSTAI